MPASGNRFVRYLRRFGAGSMLISVIVHVFLIVGATVWVVSTVKPSRKTLFQAGDEQASAVQHPVKMSTTQPHLDTLTQRLSVDTPDASVALPDLPSLPDSSPSAPSLSSSLSAAGGTGPSLNAPLMPAFGFKEAHGGTLVAKLYDLKQLKGRRPNPDLKRLGSFKLMIREIRNFINGGWNKSYFGEKFFTAPLTLYSAEFFIPEIPSAESPKAFGAEKYIKITPAADWVALYRGKVSPPSSGTYRFVGVGDDILLVRIDGRLVLDAGGSKMTDFKTDQHSRPAYNYSYWRNTWNLHQRGGFVVGNAIELRANQYYDIQIVFSDQGGMCAGMLLYQKSGETYKKDDKGNPILPIFRTANIKPAVTKDRPLPPYMEDGPIWKAITPSN